MLAERRSLRVRPILSRSSTSSTASLRLCNSSCRAPRLPNRQTRQAAQQHRLKPRLHSWHRRPALRGKACLRDATRSEPRQQQQQQRYWHQVASRKLGKEAIRLTLTRQRVASCRNALRWDPRPISSPRFQAAATKPSRRSHCLRQRLLRADRRTCRSCSPATSRAHPMALSHHSHHSQTTSKSSNSSSSSSSSSSKDGRPSTGHSLRASSATRAPTRSRVQPTNQRVCASTRGLERGQLYAGDDGHHRDQATVGDGVRL
ncbi:hypothetical protein BC831DRAFT_273410 [Entophlyctis helioformis]|nr:hypothetical protein BC831DRAFT_273410 [Entophlyctis helioformis]